MSERFIWTATKPANLALIKYMGKRDSINNEPDNGSLSYILEHFTSTVVLRKRQVEKKRQAKEESMKDNFIPDTLLSEASKQRFLEHLKYIKRQLGFDGYFTVTSCNNGFPMSCGLSSSSSSFAALTDCAVTAISSLTGQTVSVLERARLSQRGSGSSCRSFLRPWTVWKTGQLAAPELPYKDLLHCVVVVCSNPKSVTSSEAHKRVLTSSLYLGRRDRAECRLDQLMSALKGYDWSAAFELIWQDFWDMHALFETACPPFGYFTHKTLRILNFVRKYWEDQGDGPLVTVDAGPNVHCLFRKDQAPLCLEFKRILPKRYDCEVL